MQRDYVGYAGKPPVLEWPGGNRLALSIVLNYEEGSERTVREGDGVDETICEWGEFDLGPGVRNYTIESFTEYGSRAGVWRLLDLFDKHQIKTTFFACGMALEKNPSVAKAIASRGHEVCSHGYRWEDHLNLNRDDDRARIRLAADSLERTTGVRPTGWFAKNGLKDQTRELLVEEGFLYDSNEYNEDVPYFIEVNGQPHLILPYSSDTNDFRYWRAPGFVNANEYFTFLKDSLDVLLAESATVPKMMSVGLHNRISGKPARSLAVDRFIEYAKTQPGVWIARRDEIAQWWLDNRPAGSSLPGSANPTD
ncbi:MULTISPECIES: polysaccharide deacetylase family protein [Rhodococcus]|uniref:Peptidoglycan/xylan/chitin deacetylase, PgdA/CDA1 family n=1 Tax=Rhodococcus jostii TaxID=132919 RepID=A0A1H4TGZ2_RHOJO|nr:polysaccharide deacetylase family protein [Rhodococcus jostii]SEB47595.1 Peptidoglycan/xylan/chitin deacetylase, PgdA/CDA1 family [Rhodococcus jostii]SEC55510.1 Peptidoglycan/xylan/chitin deacetylase, PgdA/CDA1 family [Rhodococcus jostii]